MLAMVMIPYFAIALLSKSLNSLDAFLIRCSKVKTSFCLSSVIMEGIFGLLEIRILPHLKMEDQHHPCRWETLLGSTPKKHGFLRQKEQGALLCSIRQMKHPDTRFTSESGVVQHSIFMEMDPRYTEGTRSMFPYRATRTNHSLPQEELDTWRKRCRYDYPIISVRDSHVGTWLFRFCYLYRYG